MKFKLEQYEVKKFNIVDILGVDMMDEEYESHPNPSPLIYKQSQVSLTYSVFEKKTSKLLFVLGIADVQIRDLIRDPVFFIWMLQTVYFRQRLSFKKFFILFIRFLIFIKLKTFGNSIKVVCELKEKENKIYKKLILQIGFQQIDYTNFYILKDYRIG